MQKRLIDSIVITGPTASGKSDIAIALYRKCPDLFELISVDSVQIYRGLDIGSGKVSQTLLDEVPHHLIDIVDPDQHFDLSQFVECATQALNEIRKRGKIALFVGGTSLYFDSFFWGVSKMPEGSPVIREKLQKEAHEKGFFLLHERLKKVDYQSAMRIHPNDGQRIIRALEVNELCGEPMSKLMGQKRGYGTDRSLFFSVHVEREELYDRINRRVDKMMEQGFLEEVDKLLQKGYNDSLKSMQSIGYAQLCSYRNGSLSLDEAVSQIKQATRKYAKKQITWFKRYKDLKIDKINKVTEFLGLFPGILEE